MRRPFNAASRDSLERHEQLAASYFVYSVPPDFTPFNGEMLFAGSDAAGAYGLWATNGTPPGTHELTNISNANAGGLFAGYIQPQFTVFNGEELFAGNDANGILDLWVTNGTSAGTHELTGISGTYAVASFQVVNPFLEASTQTSRYSMARCCLRVLILVEMLACG
jgi:hypothetical protein